MKEFDLQKARAGDPVINSAGEPGKWLYTLRGHIDIFIFESRTGCGEYLSSIKNGGGPLLYGIDADPIIRDGNFVSVHMATTKRTIWVNVWGKHGQIHSSSIPFLTKGIAEKAMYPGMDKDNGFIYYGAFPIEIED